MLDIFPPYQQIRPTDSVPKLQVYDGTEAEYLTLELLESVWEQFVSFCLHTLVVLIGLGIL